MNKKAVRGWLMYDWANSAFATTMMAAMFPIFYKQVPGAHLEDHISSSYLGYTNAAAMAFVAIAAPVLGAIADYSSRKAVFLRVLAYIGILATALTVFIGEGDVLFASVLFVLGTIGFSAGNSFYDAMLPDLVPYEERDMVSAKGFMFGYIGGGVLLAVNLAMVMRPGMFGLPDTLTATKVSFMSVAVWWFVFSLPTFRHVKDRPAAESHTGKSLGAYVSIGFRRLYETLKEVKKYPELLKYLLAFWLFNDGIGTIIVMATAYGTDIGIGRDHLIAALLITQFVGIPCTFAFGKLAKRIGSKRSLYISLFVYVVIVALGYFMKNATHFYLLAVMVGLVQGGSQSIARSIYSNLIPKGRSAEFFGFLSVSSKFSSIFGPLTFGIVGQLTGSSRLAILSLVFFFIAGIGLLTTVNMEKGRKEAGI